MTTSNNTSYESNRDKVIKGALRKCGVLAVGETPSTEDFANCSDALNNVVLRFGTLGMPLWKRIEAITAIISGQTSYPILSSLKVPQVVIKDLTGGSQYELIPKTRYDFNRLPLATTGVPVHYSYVPGLQDGVLSLWPTPDATAAATKNLIVTYQKEFDGFFNSVDTPDFPAYWTDALIYELAVNIAPEYGVPLQDRQQLKAEAKTYLDQAQGYGDDDNSLFFQPDMRLR